MLKSVKKFGFCWPIDFIGKQTNGEAQTSNEYQIGTPD